jgi:hypothetical protein
MHRYGRARDAAERFAARRQREDEAPRLLDEVPGLLNLRLAMEERTVGGTISAPKHLRHIVVDSAPALFVFVCGDGRCTDGGHDLTYEIMSALRRRQTTFEGEHECGGTTGTTPCTRILHFEAAAEYKND